MPNNIAVSITADVVDLQAKRAVMSAELKTATKDLNDFAKQAAATGTTDELRAGMLQAAQAVSEMQQKLAAATAELKEMRAAAMPAAQEVKGEFAAASVSIREMGVQLRETFGVIGEMREAMAAFAEAAIAAFAIERVLEWGKQLGEAAEKVQHTAITFGLTTAEVQRFNAEMTLLGIPTEAAYKSFTRLDKALLQAREGNKGMAAEFRQLGVDINEPMGQMELFQKTLEGLAGIEDVPTRIGVAYQMLGRNLQDIAPMISVTKEQLAEANEKIGEYGVVSDDAQAKTMALQEAFLENKIAMQGITTVLAQEFGPGLLEVVKQMNEMVKEFIASYKEGGTAKTMLEDMGAVCKLVAVILSDLVALFIALCEGLNATAYLIEAIVDPVLLGLKTNFQLLSDAAEMCGKIIDDALHLNWGSIEADFKNGLSKMADDAAAGGKAIGEAFKSNLKAAGGALAAGDAAMSAADRLANAMFGAGGANRDSPGGFAGVNGSVQDWMHQRATPQIPGGGGGKGGKGAKAKEGNVVGEWEEELTSAKTAFAMLQEEQGTYESYSLEKEAAFWREKINLTQAGSKDREAVEKKWIAAMEALRNEGNAKALESIRAQEAQSMEAAKNDAAMSKMVLQDKLEDIDAAQKSGRISAAQALAEKRDVNQKMLQLDIDLAQAEKTATIAALNAELAQEKLKPQQIKQIQDEILKQTQKFNDQIVLMNKKKDLQLKKDDDALAQERARNLNGLSRSWSQTISQMLTLQTGFMSGIRSLWQGFKQFVATILEQIVEQWLVQHGVMTAIGKLFGIHDVATSSGRAAAAAWASTAAIPIIGPELAPAAAAAAGAGALSAGLGLMSAEGGWDVPGGFGPGVDGKGGIPTIIHPQEMVLPAALAGSIRSMVTMPSRVAANDAFGSNQSSGGDAHFHFHGTVINSVREMDRWAKRNRSSIGTGVKEYARQGGR